MNKNYNSRILSLFHLSDTEENLDFFMTTEECITLLKKAINMDVNNIPIIYTENRKIVYGYEIIYVYKNFDKIFIDRYSGELYSKKINENCYSLNTLFKEIERIMNEQERIYEKETDFKSKFIELNKDFYKNRDKIDYLDKEKNKAKNKDLRKMEELLYKLYNLKAIIIDLYDSPFRFED